MGIKIGQLEHRWYGLVSERYDSAMSIYKM